MIQGRFWRRLVLVALVVGGLLAWQPLVLRYRLAKAEMALAARRPEAALELLRANARQDAGHAATHFWLARTFRHLGRFDDVRRHLQRAHDLGYPVDHLQQEQWLALAQTGQMGEAEPHLQELLTTPGANGKEICQAFVQGYCMNLQFEAAQVLLDAWQSDYPEDAEQYFLRGFLNQAILNMPDAVESYRRGLALAPDRQDARLRYAQVLLQMNKLEEAEVELRRLDQEGAEALEVQTGLARCLVQRRQTDEAAERLRRVIATDPDHLEARRQLGELEISQGRFREAQQLLDPLVPQMPYDASLLLAVAKAHRALGHEEKAKVLFDRVSEAERLESELEDLIDEAVNNPGRPQPRFLVGQILEKMDAGEDAARWYRSAVRLDPAHREAHLALAAYHEQQGDVDRAQEHRQSAQ